jgi:ABC-type multidrug transport system permease subunit
VKFKIYTLLGGFIDVLTVIIVGSSCLLVITYLIFMVVWMHAPIWLAIIVLLVFGAFAGGLTWLLARLSKSLKSKSI